MDKKWNYIDWLIDNPLIPPPAAHRVTVGSRTGQEFTGEECRFGGGIGTLDHSQTWTCPREGGLGGEGV